MLTPNQIEVFDAFLRRPYKELTYKEVKEYSKQNSNSVVQNAIAAFLTNGLVTKKEVGNVLVYSLNLENTTIFSYGDILLKEKFSTPVKITLRRIMQELSDVPFISIVIFGSYAEWKQTEKSDLDVAILVNSKKDKRSCQLSMKSAELKTLLRVDAHVITKAEFLQMLKDKYENLGKQIARKHLAVHNPAIFYSIMKRGSDDGFKIVYS